MAQGKSTRHSVRLWSGEKQMFTLTAPDKGVAYWLSVSLLGRRRKGFIVTRAEILYKLDVVQTVHLSDEHRFPKADDVHKSKEGTLPPIREEEAT